MTDHRCPCAGDYEQRRVDVRFSASPRGEEVTFEVPQEVCTLCGARTYTVSDLRRIETAYREHLRRP